MYVDCLAAHPICFLDTPIPTLPRALSMIVALACIVRKCSAVLSPADCAADLSMRINFCLLELTVSMCSAYSAYTACH